MSQTTIAPAQKIPTRKDIESRYAWNLADLYSSVEAWEKDFSRVGQSLEKVKEYSGKLSGSASVLFEALSLRTDIGRRVGTLHQYAQLNKDLDSADSAFQALTDRALMLSSKAAAAFSFIEPELLNMTDDELRALAKEFEDTTLYDFYIDELIRSRAHIRSPEVEELLAMASNVTRGASTVFGMLDNADISYPSIKDEDGNEIELTKQRYAGFMESSDRRVRKDAHNAFYAPYKAHKNTLGASLASSMNNDIFGSRARKFDSSLAAALDGDNIPLTVYHSLLDTTEKNLAGLHRYVMLRKKILKLDAVRSYDLVCPLFPEENYEVPYDEAVKSVLSGCAPLGAEYISVLKRAFDSRWVDVFETKAKRGGAYSWGNFDIHPFVLMNYNNTVDNMFTLAHEMGHAMHSWLTSKAQPYEKSHYSIFVAEVASTLNEGLLLEYLIENATSERQKMYLLNRYLDNTAGTFFNQVMYARFELAIHEKVEGSEALSPDLMNGMWRDLVVEYYGDAFECDELTPLKWSRIPHFYTDFYVYQYATSYAASQAILDMLAKDRKEVTKQYLDLLSAGGRDHPIALLKECGVDMTSPKPVESTLERFAAKVSELEKLTGL